MGTVTSLRCRECGHAYPPLKMAACERCFAPLDAMYDFKSVGLTRESFRGRPRTIWRYVELLPVADKSNIVDMNTGFTPLFRCKNLGKVFGLKELYVKNDCVNPTYSFKDRPAEVAVSKALEFGDKVVGCASTGNLAAAVAAHAGKAGLPCYVLAPNNIEAGKVAQIAAYGAKMISVKGNYDDANRLAIMASEEFGWNIVNVTSRPYYVEGSKTIAFEVCEQLGWILPDHIIVPVASGALLCAMRRGFRQFKEAGLMEEDKVKLHGAQASGCAPVAEAFRLGKEGVEPFEKPETIASSIAIGDPGDGIYVLRLVRESGSVVKGVEDKEIVEAIKLLAKHEGVFAEPAGGITIALLKKLLEEGLIASDERVVCCVTGSGLKAFDVLTGQTSNMLEVEPDLEALKRALGGLSHG